MCSQWAYQSLSVILILSNLHLTRASLKDNGLAPPLPARPSFMNRTGTLVNGRLLLSRLQERCYPGTTVSRPLIILTLARHAGPGKKEEGRGGGINICLAFKLQYIPAARRVAFEVLY